MMMIIDSLSEGSPSHPSTCSVFSRYGVNPSLALRATSHGITLSSCTMPCTSQRDGASPLLAGMGNFTYPTRNFATLGPFILLHITVRLVEPFASLRRSDYIISNRDSGSSYISVELSV